MSGISFDISDIEEVYISPRAFKRMPNLRFLKIYKSKEDGNDIENIPEDIEFPPRLRLLHWDAYPSKSLPPKFYPEHLVELNMQESQLEKLWEGTPVSFYLFTLRIFVPIRFSTQLLCFSFSFSHSAINKSEEDGADGIMAFEGTPRSFKRYKTREIGSGLVPEFGRDSIFFLESSQTKGVGHVCLL